MWVVGVRRPPSAARVRSWPAVGRCPGPCSPGSRTRRGHWAVTPGVGHGPQEGRIVGSGFPSRCRMCHWTRIVVLRVRGPLARLAVLSPRPLSPFVVPVPGSCPSCRGAALRGEACCSGLCLGRYTSCGRGLVYACTAWRLWFGSWFGRCNPCAVTGSGPAPGRGAALRYVAVVCVLAILRAVLARGTLACYGTCGLACGAVVGTL